MTDDLITKLKSAKKLGLALGGGGARGMAHLGVLKVLEENGIRPDVVSGTSFGAIVGALYCNGYSWSEMIDIYESTKWHRFLELSLKGGLIKGNALGEVLSKFLPSTFEELKKPLSVTAAILETGNEVIFNTGDLIKAVRASSCFPGVIEPVEWNGVYLVDGGIVNNVPVSALYSYAVDRTIAVNVISSDYAVIDATKDKNWWQKIKEKVKMAKPTLPIEILIKAVDIMLARNVRVNLAVHRPDLYIQTDLPGIRLYNFDKYKEIIKMGEDAARKVIENL